MVGVYSYSRRWAAFCGILICVISCISGEESVILQQLAKCELETLRLGSDLADTMNSPVSSESWSQRVHQDSVVERLGFAPYLNKGVTLTNSNVKDLQSRGNWTGQSIENSPYRVLDHEWIYMVGDSTTRQIWASFAAPFQANTFERNAKEWVRHYVSQSPCSNPPSSL